jgi:hypothetical protein
MSYWAGCGTEIVPDQAVRIKKILGNDVESSAAFIADNIVIREDTDWDTDVEVCKDVYIKDGAELTITAIASIHDGVKFVVEQGGRLRLNGGTMTNYGPGKWDGIEVWGTASAPQIPAGQHGMLIMLNNSLVEQSLNGVRGYNPNPDNGDEAATAGGRIVAWNSMFLVTIQQS